MAFNIQLSFSKEHAATGDISLAWSNYTFVRGDSNDFAFAFHTAPVPGMLLSRRFVFGSEEAGTIRRETVDIGFRQAMGLFLMFNGTSDGEKFSTAAFVGPGGVRRGGAGLSRLPARVARSRSGLAC